MTTFPTTPPRRSFGYRVAIFAFGVLAYALGVGALVALVLISVGVLPFTGGPIGTLPLPAALALDLGLLVLFGVQHSVMARPAFKARWTRVIPPAAERSTYLFATALALLPLLLLWQPLPTVIWSAEGAPLRGLLIAVTVGGWVYLLAASFAINHFELFGLEQVYRALRDRPLSQSPFQVRWMYRFDRHPIMSGILIALWATPTMTLDRLLFALGTTIYICIGVSFEERALRRQLGRPYEDYCQRVRSLVPTFKSRSENRAERIRAHG